MDAREDNIQKLLDIRQFFRVGWLKLDHQRGASSGNANVAIALQPASQGCFRCGYEVGFGCRGFDPTLDVPLLLDSTPDAGIGARRTEFRELQN